MDNFRGKSDLLSKIDYLEDVIEENVKIIDGKDREIAKIKEVLTGYRCKNVVDEKDYIDLKTKYETLTTNYNEHSDQYNRLKKEEKDYLVEIRNLNKLLSEKDDEIERFKQIATSIKVFKTENQILAEEVSNQHSLINNQKDEIKNYTDYINKLENEMREIREQYIHRKVSDSFNKSCSFLGTSMLDFSTPEIGESIADIKINQLELEKQELLTENSKLHEKLTHFISENSEMTKKLSDQEIKINELDKDYSNVLDNIADLKSLLEHSSTELQNKNEEMINQQSNFDCIILEYSSAKEKMKLQLKEDLEKIDKLEQNINEAELKIVEKNTLYNVLLEESNQLKELNNQIMNDKRLVEDQLVHNKEIIDDLKTKNLSNESKISELINSLEQNLLELGQLENVNNALINEKETLHNSILKHISEQQELKQDKIIFESKISEINSMLSDKLREIEESKILIQKLTTDKTSLEEQLCHDKEIIDDLKTKNLSNESRISELTNSLEQNLLELDQLENVNNALINEKKTLNNSILKHISAHEQLSQQNASNLTLIRVLKQNKIISEDKISDINSLLSDKSQEIEQLKILTEKLNCDKDALQQKLIVKASLVNNLESEAMKSANKIAEMDTKKTDTEHKLAEILKLNQELKSANQTLDNTIIQLNAQVNELTNTKEDLIADINYMSEFRSSEVHQLQKSNQELWCRIEILNNQNEELLAIQKDKEEKHILELANTNNKLERIESLFEKVSNANLSLSKQVEEQKLFIEDLQKSNIANNNHESELVALQQKNKELEDSNKLLNDKLADLISNNENSTKQLNENEASIKSYAQIIENYQNVVAAKSKELMKKDSIIRKLNYDLEIEQKSFVQERKTKERLLKENSLLENDIKKLMAEKKASQFVGSLPDCSMNSEYNLDKSSSICRSKTSLNSYTLPQGTGHKFEMADEEGQFMDPNEIETSKLFPSKSAVSNENRISTLMQRNSLLQPHLRSTYPVELQTVSFDENSIRRGSQANFSPTSSMTFSNSSLRQSSFTISSIENIPSKVQRRSAQVDEQPPQQPFRPINKSKYLDSKKQDLHASSGLTLKSITPSKIFKRVIHSKQRTWTPTKK